MRADKPSFLISGLFAAILVMASAPASYASEPEEQVAQPMIKASNGATTCTPAQTVAITDATAGAVIYYTTDGSTPSTSSNRYINPVTLAGTQPLLARAFVSGYQPSKTVAAMAGKLLACDDEITISSGGLQRTFLVHVPASYAARSQENPSPLVLDVHGYYAGNETPTQVAEFQVDNSGEKEMSDEYGFIVAWPEATQYPWEGTEYHSWAGVYCCTPALGKVDDVGFLRQVIEWGEANGQVDTNRVYVTGFSNGAQMTQRMACEASDVVKAIAPVSWPINESADKCAVTHPMPVMEVHGTSDETIKYYGNTTPPVTSSDPPVTTSAAVGAEVWRQINQCDTSTPPETYVTAQGIKYNGPASGEPDKITKIKGTHCANGVYTGLITVYNAPHVVFTYASQKDQFDMAHYFWNNIFDKR